MKKDLISIIVPFYNMEKYLSRCIDSILNQDYQLYELIIINDGSTDNSDKICQEYIKKDSRIKYIKQENRGISESRNRGIKESSGKYISFIDSDDIVSPKYLSTLYENLITNKVDISCCSFQKFSKECTFNEDNNIQVIDNVEGIKKLLNESLSSFLWDKLIPRKLFSGISFKKDKIFEDTDVMYKIFSKAKKIVITDAILYGYCQRNSSYVHSYKYDRITNYIEVIDERYNYLIKYDKKIKKELDDSRIFSVYMLFRIIALSREKEWLNKEEVKKEYTLFKKLYNKEYNGSKKGFIKLLKFNRQLFYYLYYFLYKISGRC